MSGDSARTASDAVLAAAAASGDRHAFGELHRRWARPVHAVLISRVSPADADDLTQDVFVTALERLGSLRDPAAFGAWLLAMARSRAADLHRRPRLAPVPEDVAAPPPREGLETAAVLAALAALPEAFRETLAMRLVEGMTGPDIAERTGMTPGSVRVNLHRGMALLRQSLGTNGNNE